ncbi:MAG: hypothetical protein JWP89_4215 [Schlesneria sp.]|nr:hypothetical protein [Schlesneria sp.]
MRLNGGFQWDDVLTDPFCVLVLKRLIADPPRGTTEIDGRWTGDAVILPAGWGGEDNLHDRASLEFTDISYLALARLCDKDKVFNNILNQAMETDSFFVELCNALREFAPGLLLDKPFTTVLGVDWSRRYKKVCAQRY